MNTGVIILAAGAATRISKPKMLLPINGKSILSLLLAEVEQIKPVATLIVTGHYHKEIEQQIDQNETELLYNEDWAKGVSTSIRVGVMQMLEKNKRLDSILIAVSDQPYLNSALLQQMLVKKKSGKGIVAASYSHSIGTPVLFDKKYFPALQKLEGDRGAKSILQAHFDDMETVDFPMGEMDIDTEEDYEEFCRQKGGGHV
jgi:molybdenum cofactor cytidylyltransferase